MRILFISHSSGMLGAERSLLEMAQEATATGHEIHVSVPSEGPLRKELTRVGVATHICRTYAWMGPRHKGPAGLLRIVQNVLTLPSHCTLQWRVKPDLVVTNTSVVPVGAAAAFIMRVRHAWIVRESIATNPSLSSLIRKQFITRFISSASSDVLAVSTFVACQFSSLSSHTKSGRSSSMPAVISPSAGVPFVKRKERQPDGRLHLLMSGYISPEKGQLLAVQAVHLLRQKNIAVILTLAGSGEKSYLGNVRDFVAENGLEEHISFVGWQDDLSDLYSETDAVLMLSCNEAYGRVSAEALLHGIPVVGLNAGGTSEVLANGGGVLFDHPEPQILCAVIEGNLCDSSGLRQLRSSAAAAGNHLASLPGQFSQLANALAI